MRTTFKFCALLICPQLPDRAPFFISFDAQYNHPKICHRVKALFEKHGVEYDVRPYFVCMQDTYRNLWAIGHHREMKSH